MPLHSDINDLLRSNQTINSNQLPATILDSAQSSDSRHVRSSVKNTKATLHGVKRPPELKTLDTTGRWRPANLAQTPSNF